MLSKGTKISLDSMLSEESPYIAVALAGLRGHLQNATSQLSDVANSGNDVANSGILLSMIEQPGLATDSYKLTIQKDGIHLQAHGPEGFSYGVTTLSQLLSLPSDAGQGTQTAVPAMLIEDSPAFKWRGLHLDVSRHFFPAEDVKKLLAGMAAYKLNRFHWHLTDDQGWRFPVEGYEKLTQQGAGRRFKGTDTTILLDTEANTEGFYTQKDIEEVRNFAKARHIEIIPEVDVPGHCAAAIAAYPSLGNQDFTPPAGPVKEYGVQDWTLAPTQQSVDFLQAVFTSVAKLFPDSEYIHLGGDEAPNTQWHAASAAAKKEWLPNEGHNVQSFFNTKVSEIISNNGKKIGGWDEVQSVPGLPSDAVIFAWRGEGEVKKAVKAGRQVVNADLGHLYFDHIQGPQDMEPHAIDGPLTSVKEVYQYDPLPLWVSENDKHLVLGGQAQLWTEYFPNWKHVEYMAFPRAIALAERLWTPAKDVSYPEFKERLQKRVHDLTNWGINYHPISA
jgi:hexosaminidase